jgi:hypothetical protein
MHLLLTSHWHCRIGRICLEIGANVLILIARALPLIGVGTGHL